MTVSDSSATDAASVSRPTGPPPKRSISVRSSVRSRSSRPRLSMPSLASAVSATPASIVPSPRTSA